MMIYWESVRRVTNEYHDGGGLLVVADTLEIARAMAPPGCEARIQAAWRVITYVWDSKVRSANPGYCYKRAGWRMTGRSADGRKSLLQKPFDKAGTEPLCAGGEG
jgi:hypothetical protein